MSADFWAGYISGAAGILIGNPLDLVKVRLQAGGDGRLGPAVVGGGPATGAAASSASSSSSSFSRALFQRTAALATGAAAPVLGYGALNALLFVSYRQAETFMTGSSSASGSISSSSSAPTATTTWIAGAVAGLATWIVSAPTELVKCRAQLALAAPTATASSVASASTASPASLSQPPKSPSSWAIARQVWRAEGVRGFFLGGTVTALRDSIGYGFYFWSYLLATDAWRRYETGGADQQPANASPSATATLMCGGLAGVVTWASVFPLDVIKTRVQAQALLPPSPANAPLLSGSTSPSSQPRRLSTLKVAQIAYHEGGMSVFFRGLGVCSARAFVVNAVQWAVYEWIMRELGAKV
ncbi:hypothetical protein SBRCBS47491_006178 [Sporothrix bragantina]|uniref:Solute carrier family 25 (Mitochondrial carnitine/acylcarnitine transporter), member 20/29 n=1 Tax=Sporothrix bragantina TaxID=671064 RepID=A0ABP0C4W3_9PEZI